MTLHTPAATIDNCPIGCHAAALLSAQDIAYLYILQRDIMKVSIRLLLLDFKDLRALPRFVSQCGTLSPWRFAGRLITMCSNQR